MCTKINIRKDLICKIICDKCNYLYKNKNDLQKKLTGYLVERLRISTNKITGTIAETTNKFK